MAFTRTHIGIAVGAGVLLVGIFVGYLWWLSNQGPVLARSDDRDPLTVSHQIFCESPRHMGWRTLS